MNKSNVAQVLGVLCKNPQILQRTDEFQLSPDDFDNILDKYIFSTIYNCFNEGAECLTIIDIDKSLKLSPAAYSVWERHDGANYLSQAIDLGNEGNFTNYYNNLKKANLLRDLNKIGIDTSCIYSTDVFDEDISEKNELFQKMTTQDITEFFKKKLGILEYKYGLSEVETIDMGQKIRGIFSDFETNSVVGAKLMGDYFNTVVGGARKGTLFMMSSTSAGGKTRNAIGNACELAFPVRYNWRTNKWERRYSSDKILYIATEQD
jgi:replicative DNA helicase